MRPLLVLLFSCVLMGLPQQAEAQRMPAEGSVSVGGALGVFFPADETFGGSPWLEGQFQYQFTPRVGLRFGLGWTNPEFDVEDEDSLRQIRIGGDLIYNWERRQWHPYVGGGIGAHLMQAKDNGDDIGDGDGTLGVSLLGGVEYFFTDDAAITGEARYQFVDDFGPYDPSGFVIAIGVKKYF